jgi:multiple sugar transport system permease protein
MNAGTERNIARRAAAFGRFVILLAFLAVVLLPVYWMMITSLKTPQDIYTLDIQYWPENFTINNYFKIWNNTPFQRYLANSLTVSAISGAIVLIISIFGGYAMARYQFRLKKTTIMALLISQIIPITLLLIPLYLMFTAAKLTNSLAGLVVLYVVFNTPFCVITMQSFFKNIPAAIEEAALIDGCSRLQMMWHVVLPVMLPGIVAVFIFAFVGAWNELLSGVMFINTEIYKTIPVGLNAYVGQFAVEWGEMMAGGMLALIPSVILFAVAQRYIVDGLTAGAVKG